MVEHSQIYDRIGEGYSANRLPDPRIARLIHQSLDGAASVLNVGAGTGSYEPDHAQVTAVEPSLGMIRQRPEQAAPVVRASAHALPFCPKSFDASMAILTLHHWPDPGQGLQELLRVSRKRIVIFTWDPDFPGFWLTKDYFPELNRLHQEMFPKLGDYEKALGSAVIKNIPIPCNCTDGFLGAYWQRPEAYLDPKVRGAMSVFSRIKSEKQGVEALRRDLASGVWKERNANLLDQESLDLGYRLIIKEL